MDRSGSTQSKSARSRKRGAAKVLKPSVVSNNEAKGVLKTLGKKSRILSCTPSAAVSKRIKKNCTQVLRKVIVDTDPGVDDAVSLLMILKEPSIQLLAITVTQGNSTLKNTSRNTLRILNMADRKDIPVYLGSTSSILNKQIESDNYFGEDGMGDTITDYDEDLAEPKSERAVSALIRLADEHKGDVTLLCIGPLTNIALAQRVDSSFGSKLKECYIMGGNYQGRGNITQAAEFNFYHDPEAAYIVLNELECPITLIPWELCTTLDLDWRWYKNITNKNTKCSKFLRDIGLKMVKNAKKAGIKYFVPADEFAAGCLIDNDLALESLEILCRVELAGQLTRGQVVIDWKASMNEAIKKRVKVVTKIHESKFKAMMENLTS